MIRHYEVAKYEMDHIHATNVSFEDWDEDLTISAIYCHIHATDISFEDWDGDLTISALHVTS
jgi:hypothetical protein